MNKDGGLSVFDVKSNTTKEILDNTTFVSIPYHTNNSRIILDVSVVWIQKTSVKSYFLKI